MSGDALVSQRERGTRTKTREDGDARQKMLNIRTQNARERRRSKPRGAGKRWRAKRAKSEGCTQQRTRAKVLRTTRLPHSNNTPSRFKQRPQKTVRTPPQRPAPRTNPRPSSSFEHPERLSNPRIPSAQPTRSSFPPLSGTTAQGEKGKVQQRTPLPGCGFEAR